MQVDGVPHVDYPVAAPGETDQPGSQRFFHVVSERVVVTDTLVDPVGTHRLVDMIPVIVLHSMYWFPAISSAILVGLPDQIPRPRAAPGLAIFQPMTKKLAATQATDAVHVVDGADHVPAGFGGQRNGRRMRGKRGMVLRLGIFQMCGVGLDTAMRQLERGSSDEGMREGPLQQNLGFGDRPRIPPRPSGPNPLVVR